MNKKNKIGGMSKISLYDETGKFIRKDVFMNIIGNLYNKDLIELPDEYWIEEDNGWKSYYRKNYNKIFYDFKKLTNYKYEVRINE